MREQFKDAAEGDGYMLQRWADLVRPEDHIYHLGDLTLARGNHRDTDLVKIVRGLPGHKTLFLGNHDHKDARKYFEYGFQKVRASNVADGLLLTHYPVHPGSLSLRVRFNAHGHTHGAPDIDHRYLNVCVERTAYEPIPIEEAKRRLVVKQLAVKPPEVDVSGNRIEGP